MDLKSTIRIFPDMKKVFKHENYLTKDIEEEQDSDILLLYTKKIKVCFLSTEQ